MSMFAWKDSYSVGFADIDAQHRRLFQLASELHAAMIAGKGKDAMEQVLGNLVSYTRTHFAAEEGLMRRHSYPEYLAHKNQHDDLTRKVLALQEAHAANRATLTLETMRFLSDWLTQHIGSSDRRIGAFLAARTAA
jgi:hemerythrin